MEHLPEKYARSLARMKPSLSAFVLYVATDLDVTEYDNGNALFLFDHRNHAATYTDINAGKVGGMWVSLPTIIDPSLAPEGHHLVICSTLAPYEIGVDWQREGAQRYEQSMLDIIEKRLLPGLRDRIKFSERATPLTFERYTLNHRGAIYGWDHIPSQSTPKRLPHHTPVDGLWLAGHWTEPGCSSFRVI
jgi:prolycopene isomerase